MRGFVPYQQGSMLRKGERVLIEAKVATGDWKHSLDTVTLEISRFGFPSDVYVDRASIISVEDDLKVGDAVIVDGDENATVEWCDASRVLCRFNNGNVEIIRRDLVLVALVRDTIEPQPDIPLETPVAVVEDSDEAKARSAYDAKIADLTP